MKCNSAFCRASLALGIAVFSGLAGDAQAGDNWLGGFVLQDGVRSKINRSSVNPGNFLGMSSLQMDSAVLLEGRHSDVDFRLRAQVQANPQSGQTGSTTLVLQELSKTFALSEDLSLALGKRLYSIDQSFIGQPLGFFQKQTDLSDPTDAAGKSEGLPMLVLSWMDEKTTLSGIYSDDFNTVPDGMNRGIRQWVWRAAYEFKNLSTSLVFRRADGESAGWGGSFSATLAEDVSVYGSLYTASGTQRPYLRALFRQRPFFAVNEAQAIGFLRANNDVSYPRFTVGAMYTPRDWPRLQMEFIYDRRGLSGREYADYLNLIRFHATGAQRHVAPQLVNANLAFDAELLLARGMRRRYLSLNLDHNVDPFSLSCGAYLGLEDRSSIVYFSGGYALRKALGLSLSVSTLQGSADSERGLLPVSGSVSARIKYSF
jgi:hypothetical protein